MPTLAYVVSAHGFGHAARSAAIIDALGRRRPDLSIEILSTAPRWFFEQSLQHSFGWHHVGWHHVETDLGLVQSTALEEDLDATVTRLEAFLDDPGAIVDPLIDQLRRLRPQLVVCDISPWGLAAANHLGLPAVLVENFTWDWIYRGYDEPRLHSCGERLAELGSADRHLRLEPFCGPIGTAEAMPPVARRPRLDPVEVRHQLGIPEHAELAMVTMGGVPWSFGDLERQLAERRGERWLLVAGGADRLRRARRAVLIPHRSEHFHPDLVRAADAVVGKLGYSTLAEVAEAGVRFLYVPRARFPESRPLESWARRHLAARSFSAEDFTAGDWLERLDLALDRLATLPRRPPRGGGAEAVTGALLELL